MTASKPSVTERRLNEAQFKKVVRQMARKAITEHIAKKKAAAVKLNEARRRQAAATAAKPAQTKKITKDQLREMVRDSILECLEEELTKRTSAKK